MTATAKEFVDDILNEGIEPPRPLMRELPPADPFPTDALTEILANAAAGIQDRVQAPFAICAQSVLSAATLAVQGHANVRLPTGQLRPISCYFATIGVTGERKTAADTEATWPIRKREAALRDLYPVQRQDHENSYAAWEHARKHIISVGKGDRVKIKAALEQLGAPPREPLLPLLTASEPTIEGLTKVFAKGWPSLGVFSDEGGSFVGGHAMTEEARLRTATTLSRLWDGAPVDRVRSGDGFLILPGRRLAMHLMLQPNVATLFLGDGMLAEQGLLSRVLASAPESNIGNRMWREASEESSTAIKAYGAHLLDILELPLPLVHEKQNELVPREIQLSHQALTRWVTFHDHIEHGLKDDGPLWSIKGLANKIPEIVARLAGVLSLVQDIGAREISAENLVRGIALAEHYVAEALRLFEASRVNGDLVLAQKLLDWFHRQWSHDLISLPDIYQRSLNAIGDKATAAKMVNVLAEHGWLLPVLEGAEIAGRWRREVWRIVKHGD